MFKGHTTYILEFLFYFTKFNLVQKKIHLQVPMQIKVPKKWQIEIDEHNLSEKKILFLKSK